MMMLEKSTVCAVLLRVVANPVTRSKTYAAVGATTTTAYKVSDLTNGTAYYFVMTCVNASGESIYSNQAVTTPIGRYL